MRQVALDILYKYKKEGSYLNIAVNAAFEHLCLSREDRDLITQIVYGTIQREIYLDYQLRPYIKGKIKPYIQIILRMSLYQMLFLDKIPEYAILNEAVEMTKRKYGEYPAKMVNAILRNVMRDGTRDILCDDPLEKLSIETSTPLWLVKMLNKQLGYEDAYKTCHAYIQIPTLAARVNTLKANRADLLDQYPVKEGYLSEDAILFERGNIAHHELYIDGKVTIQDESSQLVGRLLTPAKGSRVLDMCAAPGSKTMHLAALMENTGQIEAYDLYEHKIKLINQNIERLGVKNVQAKAMDSTKLTTLYKDACFDAILLDAPCSGLGVIARKPEIKYQDSSNMDGIMQIQKDLLEEAYLLLKKGGVMVYSTCTINKKENQSMIKAFITKHPDMKKEKEKLILPFQYHSDGFYMCRMIKE